MVIIAKVDNTVSGWSSFLAGFPLRRMQIIGYLD